MHVFFDVMTGDDAPGDITIIFGHEVKTEKDAQRLIYLFNAFKEQDKRSESAEGRLAGLEGEMLAFDSEMTVEALVDHLRLSGLLGEKSQSF